jgi:hypothetical protein
MLQEQMHGKHFVNGKEKQTQKRNERKKMLIAIETLDVNAISLIENMMLYADDIAMDQAYLENNIESIGE